MTAVITFILRLAAGLIGFAILLCVLALAVLSTLVFIVWSLLRGRRPKIDVSRFQRATRGSASATGRPFGNAGNAADVVDVEVREVPDHHPGLSDHSSGSAP